MKFSPLPFSKMRLCSLLQLALALIFVTGASAWGQTLSLNDASILQAKTNRIGVNIGSIDYWDSGQILKNLIGAINPGFEPLTDQQIWVVANVGTPTTFTVPDMWDGVPANYWAGGTFTVVSVQSGGAELGCTGTIASNTGPNYPAAGITNWVPPVVTVSSPCAAPFSVGDIVIMGKSVFPTPESWWESSQGGFWGGVTGGGKLLSDTSDLCATCGQQALNMNATAIGSSATASWYFDTATGVDLFVLMNGTYQISYWAKAASGNPALNVSAARLSSGGFNCGSHPISLTSAWAQYTLTCTASESAASTVPGNAQVSFQASGGSVYLDNVSFQKTASDPSNTTVLRDEVIQTLQKYYGPSINGNPGMFRFWLSQNAETLGNWTQPDYAHAPTSTGTGYFVGPNGAGTTTLSIEDYLVICQLLNAQPYLEVPVTFSTADAANLIEFLASPPNTVYGARRAALGQTNPWTSVFGTIHLSFCNECWNGSSFVGQSLPYRSGTPNAPNTNDPEYYYDYSMRAKSIFAAMRADSYYSSPSFDLVMNAQTAVNYSMDPAIQRVKPDSIEIEGYTYSNVNDFGSDAALWGPAMVEPYERVANPNDATNFYNSLHDYQSQNTCGASGTATCKVNIYEWGQGTLAGSIDQTHMDYINAGAGEGVVMALQPLLNLQYYGIVNQSNFALNGYQNGAVNGRTAKLWGNVIDMGGATNNLRPAFLAVSLVNQSIVGPMYSCPITSNPTYNFAANGSNGSPTMPAINNVPYVYAFCFESGSQRSLVLINTDLSSSHAIGFVGTNPPTGTVTQRQYAPSALDAMNEAPTSTPTTLAPATVALNVTSLSSPSSITLPPYSVTALDYTVSSSGTVATPTFTPAAGTYSAPQTVSINDATAGATIYYTTNGTTPTTSSSVYSASTPITVSSNETVQAIAVASGYNNSPVATAAYVISLPVAAAPKFSVAEGTYTGAQTVSISDTTAGAAIYYTINGTAPTTTSTLFSSAITVSASETIEAMAVAPGFSSSPVATAAYVINLPGTAAPTFSLASGTYTGAQAVSISDATTGAAIYYTTNGATPTTNSTRYSGTITVSASETVEALAVASGYSNSSVATAAYVINLPVAATPTFSLTGGTYTGTQTVSIGDTTAGAAIFYTTNGTVPTINSTRYSGAIAVSVSETVEAIAVASGYNNSSVASANYQISAPATLIANGTYAIVNRNSGLALEVPGWSGAQGALLDQWSANGGANQRWQLTNLGGNYVELVNVNSGLAIEVNGSSTANGAGIDQRQFVGAKNQIWSVVSIGGYYELINENSGLALEVPGWSGTPGTLLDQWSANGGGNQVWSIR